MIEDYALIGDTRSAALVSLAGSIDWMCAPRFDSPAVFAALIGTPENGHWSIAPVEPYTVERRYRDDTLVLDTTFTTASGTVTLTDCMRIGAEYPCVVRSVRGIRGSVAMRMRLRLRFDYGSIVPWVRDLDGMLRAVGGPDAMALYCAVPTRGEDLSTVAEFTVADGATIDFELAYSPSHRPSPRAYGAPRAIDDTCRWWEDWSARCTHRGDLRSTVVRSLITLKALTYATTGAIVAAPTTSLPEAIGGVRNWDYRYCWLRDATFVLYSFLNAGYADEAVAWRAWLLRAVAGAPNEVQIMYGLRGERRLPEMTLPWLSGYERSQPVRIGNGAADQFQLDVFGEVLDVMYASHTAGMPPDGDEWSLMTAVIEAVVRRWSEPDRGLWEVRGPARHFTHSKVLAWVALDRAVKAIERFGLDGPLARWTEVRDTIHADVCARGFDPVRATFTQSYGSRELDASTLLIPLVGFLPAGDPRVRGTVAAIERDLLRDGLLLRYSPLDEHTDGLPPGEGAFLACNFWLVDNYVLAGRDAEARALFDRLAALTNDVGLLAEEYDTTRKRQVGNFPQAFSHVGLINSAANLMRERAPAQQRSE